MVSQFVTQDSIHNSYISGPCLASYHGCTLPCHKDDWSYDSLTCAGGLRSSQYKCSKVDPSLCPKINGHTAHAKFDTPPRVKCSYPLNIFNNTKSIKKWKNTWGTDDSYNNMILPNFCRKTSNKCPINPITSKPFEKCTLFTATDESGNICRDWANNNPTVSDNLKRNICDNSGLADCLCLNRFSDPLYNDIKVHLNPNIPDECWWKPCRNSENYVQLSSNSNVCPTNICDLIRNIILNYNLDLKYTLSELNAKLNCQFDIYEPPSPNTFALLPWIIAIIVIAILLIFVIVIWCIL